jgi:tRNA (Thr-GGU) A37 N-methylase
MAIEGVTLVGRALDCLDRTPLVDLKPDRATAGD